MAILSPGSDYRVGFTGWSWLISRSDISSGETWTIFMERFGAQFSAVSSQVFNDTTTRFKNGAFSFTSVSSFKPTTRRVYGSAFAQISAVSTQTFRCRQKSYARCEFTAVSSFYPFQPAEGSLSFMHYYRMRRAA